jgi:hypothetical protein
MVAEKYVLAQAYDPAYQLFFAEPCSRAAELCSASKLDTRSNSSSSMPGGRTRWNMPMRFSSKSFTVRL